MAKGQYILRDPGICGGTPVVRGTRVPIRTILDSLNEGATVDEILADYPSLTEKALRGALEECNARLVRKEDLRR